MSRLSWLKCGIIFFGLLMVINISCKSAGPAVDADKVKLELKAQKSIINTLSLDANGNKYTIGFDNGTIKLFDFRSGNLLKSFTIDEQYLKYGKYNHIFYIDFSAHGKWLAAGSEDGFVRIWDISSGKLLHSLEHPAKKSYSKGVFTVAFSPDSRLLASSSSDSVMLWDAASGTHIHTFNADSEYSVVFSKDSTSMTWRGIATSTSSAECSPP